MKKNNKESNKEISEEIIDEVNSEVDENAIEHETSQKEKLREFKQKLQEKTIKCDEYMNLLQRNAAEFDNFKKRTVREKEAIYSNAICNVIEDILPVIDNFDRAMQVANKEEDFKALKEGIDLVFRQLKDVMKNLGVEEIKCLNENFNPELHNAVMHVEDDECGENIIIEELQKGYLLKDKVIRHSMVKVAN